MISCCTHYLTNVLPVLGATGVVALVAQYQVELFWLGLAFNLAGVRVRRSQGISGDPSYDADGGSLTCKKPDGAARRSSRY